MSISFVASTTGTGTDTSAEITIPSGTTQDDILIASVAIAHFNADIGNFTWPGGWTVVDSCPSTVIQVTGRYRVYIAWKKFNTGDGTQTVTVPSTSYAWVSACSAYRSVDLTTPLLDNSLGTINGSPSSAAFVTPTATDSTADVWRVSMHFTATNSADCTHGSYTAGNVERAEQFGTTAFRCTTSLCDSDGAVDGSSGTSVSCTPSVSTNVRAGWIAYLKPGAVNPDAGHASASTASNAPTASVKPDSGTVSATVAANSPVVPSSPGAGTVAVAAAAHSPSVVTTANTDTASASAEAHQTEAGHLSSAGETSATVSTNDATVIKDNGHVLPTDAISATAYGASASVSPTPADPVVASAQAELIAGSLGAVSGQADVLSDAFDSSGDMSTPSGYVEAQASANDSSGLLGATPGTADVAVSALNASEHIDATAGTVEVAASVHAPSMGLTPESVSASAEALGVGTGLTPTEVDVAATAYTVSVSTTSNAGQTSPPQAVANDAAVHIGVPTGDAGATASTSDAVQGVGVLAEHVSAEMSGFYIPYAGKVSVSVAAFNITSQQNTVPPTRQVKIPAEVRQTVVQGVRDSGEGLRIVKIPSEVRQTVVS